MNYTVMKSQLPTSYHYWLCEYYVALPTGKMTIQILMMVTLMAILMFIRMFMKVEKFFYDNYYESIIVIIVWEIIIIIIIETIIFHTDELIIYSRLHGKNDNIQRISALLRQCHNSMFIQALTITITCIV